MNERLLQFIWQFQYFNKQELQTAGAEPLQIIHPGHLNTNQGPDFKEASVKIGNTVLVGAAELHLRTSDWLKHQHDGDANYKNVVLHIVWQHDATIHTHVPVLELQHRVSKIMLQQYQQWMNNPQLVPCAGTISSVKELVWMNWKERLLAERLERKAAYALQLLQQNKQHWQETFWQLLARNFGIKINADAFEAIAKSLPVTILAKHKNQLPVLEALLLGQAGLLQGDFTEDYPKLLQREYQFYQAKYQLQPLNQPVHFLRMRPASFPTVRLAQLAALVYDAAHLFSKIKEATTIDALIKLLNVTANDYWHYHYRLDEPADYKPKKLGRQMVMTIIINSIVPVVFAYGLMHKDELLKEKALYWLQQLPAEKNTITAGWQQLGITSQHAFDSQALIELKTQYCSKKRCLDCGVGNALLKMVQ